MRDPIRQNHNDDFSTLAIPRDVFLANETHSGGSDTHAHSSGMENFIGTSVGHDVERYKEILRGKIRKDLGSIIAGGPLPYIDTPRFIHGKAGSRMLGAGDASPGDVLGSPRPGNGNGQAGNSPGEHLLASTLRTEDILNVMDEMLELPELKKVSEGDITQAGVRFTGLRQVGPRGLMNRKRTFSKAMIRELASGTYVPGKAPSIVHRDELFKGPKPVLIPKTRAAILYILDISGSMRDEDRTLARHEAAWINTWLDQKYEKVDHRYIVHDSDAKEVDFNSFHRLREAGGTAISSSYSLARDIIGKYPADQVNFYAVQFSDGDNLSSDNKVALGILEKDLLPVVSMFGYCQISNDSGSGRFIRAIKESEASSFENLKLSELDGRPDIWPSILNMFGRATKN